MEYLPKGILLLLFCSYISFSAHALTISFSTLEKQPKGTIIGSIIDKAGLSDQYSKEDLSRLRFVILKDPTNNSSQTYINLDNQTGIFEVKNPINRDYLCPSQSTCAFQFDVGQGPAELFQIISVRIDIVDLDDFTPIFPVNSTTIQILENVLPGSSFPLPSAVDNDSPPYGIQRYELTAITPPDGQWKFSLLWSGELLQLMVNERLDREMQDRYILKVAAIGGGDRALTGYLSVEIQIQDVNDNPPVFAQLSYAVGVKEDTPAGTALLTVRATDKDIGVNGLVKYYLQPSTSCGAPDSPLFTINDTTGVISLVSNGLDRETCAAHYLTIVAKDGGVSQLSASVSVNVTVIDVNDNAPKITINTLTDDSLAEVPENSEIGTFTALISASDDDIGDNGNVSCTLDGNSDAFELRLIQYSRYKLVTKIVLDREQISSYNITVICSDHGTPPLSSQSIIMVRVLDVNDNAPIFSSSLYTGHVAENLPSGTFVIQVLATDKDIGDNARIKFSLYGQSQYQFTIDQDSGIIRTNMSFDHEQVTSVVVNVLATDCGTPALSSSAIIQVIIDDVNDNPPEFNQSVYIFAIPEHTSSDTIAILRATDPDSGNNSIVYYSIESNESHSDTNPGLAPMVKPTGLECFFIEEFTGKLKTMCNFDRNDQNVYSFDVIAANPGTPTLSDTIHIIVYITDANGNAIVVDYPTIRNDSVMLSNKAKIGYQVAQVTVHHLRPDRTSPFEFHLNAPSEHFSVDKNEGIITVNSDLSKVSKSKEIVSVRVDDTGDTKLKSIVNMTIQIDDTLPAPADPVIGENNKTGNRNIIIVACVVSISGVIAILLVVAILYIMCRNKASRRDAEYGQKKSAKSGGNNNEGKAGTKVSTVVDGIECVDGRSDNSSSSGFVSGKGDESLPTIHPVLYKRGPGTFLSLQVPPDTSGEGSSPIQADADSSNSSDSGRGPSLNNYNTECSSLRDIPAALPIEVRRVYFSKDPYIRGTPVYKSFPTELTRKTLKNDPVNNRLTSSAEKRHSVDFRINSKPIISASSPHKMKTQVSGTSPTKYADSFSSLEALGCKLIRRSTETSDGETSVTSGSYTILPVPEGENEKLDLDFSSSSILV